MPLFLSKQTMSDLLITAWEGGSNYWVEEAEIIPPKGMSLQELRRAAWEAVPRREEGGWKDDGPDARWPLYALLPYLPASVKWKIKFTPTESDEVVYLTPENMRQAIATLSKKGYSHIVKGIKAEDYDAGYADAWLQAAVFGEVIYG